MQSLTPLLEQMGQGGAGVSESSSKGKVAGARDEGKMREWVIPLRSFFSPSVDKGWWTAAQSEQSIGFPNLSCHRESDRSMRT